VARIKVDSLNTAAHNKELKATLESYSKELGDKEKLIEKYEVEIRQRHDKIEKKQVYIARLNKKYEQLVANKQDENTGPLEATIKNLNKEISAVVSEMGDLSREWIKSQTMLVQLVSDTTQETQAVKELSAKQTVLTQRKIRLANSYIQHMNDVKELGGQVKQLHTELAKINVLIAKNTDSIQQLTDTNFTIETDFANKLKELEKGSILTDASISSLAEEKAELLEALIDAERQIMLWEKKIQLERETQEALDPQYGQAEIRGMKKEIHRMELRLTALKRQQEKMVSEMERSISKHDTIKLANISSKTKSAMTQGTFRTIGKFL